MHISARLAIGLAAVAVLAVVGINVLTVNRGVVAGPTASPAASAAAAPLISPSNSPAAQVDASAPANSPQAPPSSGDLAPSASASLQPTPTPDPEAVRVAAAAGYQAAGAAHQRAWTSLPDNHKDVGRGASAMWGRYLAALRQLQFPADTAADLQDLIRVVSRLQAISGEGGRSNRLKSADARLPNPLGQDLAPAMAGCDASPVRPRPAGTGIPRPRRARPALRLVSLTGGAHVSRLLRDPPLADHPEGARHPAHDLELGLRDGGPRVRTGGRACGARACRRRTAPSRGGR